MIVVGPIQSPRQLLGTCFAFRGSIGRGSDGFDGRRRKRVLVKIVGE